MDKKSFGIPYILYFVVAALGAPVAAYWASGIIFWVYGAATITGLVALAIMAALGCPPAFRRRSPGYNSLEIPTFALLSLCFLLASWLSAYDLAHSKLAVMPSWTFVIGALLFVAGFLVLAQSLLSNPPHRTFKYGEESGKEGEAANLGPYGFIRYPAISAVLLLIAGVPLWLGSGLGFLVLIPAVIFTAAYTAKEDHARFLALEWYQEYMHSTPFRLVPFVW